MGEPLTDRGGSELKEPEPDSGGVSPAVCGEVTWIAGGIDCLLLALSLGKSASSSDHSGSSAKGSSIGETACEGKAEGRWSAEGQDCLSALRVEVRTALSLRFSQPWLSTHPDPSSSTSAHSVQLVNSSTRTRDDGIESGKRTGIRHGKRPCCCAQGGGGCYLYRGRLGERPTEDGFIVLGMPCEEVSSQPLSAEDSLK